MQRNTKMKPMNNVIIRKMNSEDCQAVYDLECKCFGDSGWNVVDYEDMVSSDNHICYIAEIDRKLVGFALVIVAVDTADLINIAVEQAYRGQGISKLLMSQLDIESHRQGWLNMTLEVRESNKIAISLYERCGFQKISVRKRYYSNPVEDANIMQKLYDIL